MSGAARLRVITTGIHGSASTLVFNLARELMEMRFGADAVHPCHALRAADLADQPGLAGRHIVAKTHGWPGIGGFAREWGARVIVTVRDPRDAIVSIMQRFDEPFERVLGAIGQECAAALECTGAPVLRYEDGFQDDPGIARRIAGLLDLPVTAEQAERLFTIYGTEGMRAFAAAVPNLPPSRRQDRGDSGRSFDRLTQITNTHIGDGRVGKWRDVLAPQQRQYATMMLRPYLAPLGYA